MKIVFSIFSILLLVYMAWPGPSSIDVFTPLPDSIKSELSGDTWQIPNIAAYYSDNERRFVTDYYFNIFKEETGLPFYPLKLNYPPEFAFTAIKDQTHATYLEEAVYPLRDSVFINGLEPFYEDGTPKYLGATPFVAEGRDFKTKATLRFYPAPLYARMVVWAGIVASTFLIWRVAKKSIW